VDLSFWLRIAILVVISQKSVSDIYIYIFRTLWRWWPPLWSNGQISWLHSGDVLCFLWGTNWIYICYVEESRPPLWSSGQSSWPQIQISGFGSRRYQIFREVLGLERGPLSLVSTIEEQLGIETSGSCLESREYGRRDSSRWLRDTLYPQKLTLTSPTSCGLSVGIVRSRTQATGCSVLVCDAGPDIINGRVC
jgi:hypothetical protein